MTIDESLRPLLLEAVAKALEGDWQGAHLMVQDPSETDAAAAWIHAVLHRMEGDVSNARYWFARCGRSLRPQLSTGDELREIEAALRG